MKRASDHSMLLARRANAERSYARSKDMRDLTEVMRASEDVKKSQNSSVLVPQLVSVGSKMKENSDDLEFRIDRQPSYVTN
jgi:hypothetical protein